MATIVGIAGSLRKASYDASLLRAAAEMSPASMAIDIASIADIPLYDGDRESTYGVPDAVAHLKDKIAASAGLLLVTPEYNHSIPGVLKNAIDWLSRPPADISRVFGNKPVALMGATPGMGGTRMAQTAWLPVFRALGLQPWFGKQLYVAGAGQVFDTGGHLIDDKIRKSLQVFLNGFAAVVGQR